MAVVTLTSISKEEEQGLRLLKLLDEATVTLRNYLLAPYVTAPTSFENELLKEEHKLRSILTKSSKPQLEILYPKTGKTNPEDYDVNLLMVLLRTIRKIPKPKTGWQEEPLITDQSISAHIIRLYRSRNKLCHSRLAKNSVEYTTYLNSISAAMLVLGSDINTVNTIINQSIDGNTTALFNQKISELEVANEQIKVLTEKLDELDTVHNQEVWYGVLPLTPTFTGRTDDVKDVHTLLSSKTSSKIATLLTGLPGTGKTALALYYCYQYQHYYNNNVVWMNANDAESLSQSFRELYLQIHRQQTVEISIKQVVNTVFKFFSDRHVLFVFDNADDNKHISDFLPLNLPPTVTKPSILITSRISQWGPQFNEKKISFLSERDALDLITNNLPEELREEQDLEKFCSLMNGYPIAIQQAIAYMTFNMVPMNEYLTQLENFEDERVLDFPVNDFIYRNSFYSSLMITMSCLQQTEHSKSLEIINVMSFMNGLSIDKMIFQKSKHYTQWEVDMALNILERLSLIEIHRNYKKKEILISLHSLVQLVIRNVLVKNEMHESYINLLFSSINNVIMESKYNVRHFEYGKKWIHHVVNIHNILPEDQSVMANLAQFADKITQALENLSRADIALSILETVKKYQLQGSKPDVDIIGTFLAELKLLVNLGCWQKGLSYCEQIERFVSENHLAGTFDECSFLYCKASCIGGLGKHEEALSLYQKLRKLELETKGAFDRLTITTENNIAYELSKLGRYDQSLKEYEKVIAKYETLESYKDDANYYLIVDNKAKNLLKIGKFREAISVFQSVLTGEIYERRVEVFGEENQYILRSKFSLADCYYAVGYYRKCLSVAQSIEEQAKSSSGQLGYNQEVYLVSQNVIANSFLSLGEYEKAMEMYNQIIKLTEILSVGRRLVDRLNIAICLQKMGNLNEALQSYRDIVRDYGNNTSDRNFWRTKINEASCLIELGLYWEALKFLDASRCAEMFGECDYYTLKKHSLLANCHLLLGNYKESKSHVQYVFEHGDGISAWHVERIRAKIVHANYLINKGKPKDAINEMETLQKESINELSETHPLILEVKFVIAIAIAKSGSKMDAVDALKIVECGQTKTLGDNHPHTLLTSFQLIILGISEESFEDRIEKLQALLPECRKQLGSNHVHSLVIEKEIAKCLIKQSKFKEAISILNSVHNQLKLVVGKKHIELREISKLLEATVDKNLTSE